MKKILFLIHDLGQGGAEKVLINLVNHMDPKELDITVMALFGGGVNEPFLAPHIRLVVCHRNMLRGNSHLLKLLSPKQLHKKYIKEHYDIEISYLEGPCARIISGCQSSDTKLISWIHVEQHTMKRLAASFRSEAEARKCYHRFDRTVCVSQGVQEDFCRILDFQKPCKVLYNTVESDKILQKAAEPWQTTEAPSDEGAVSEADRGRDFTKNTGFADNSKVFSLPQSPAATAPSSEGAIRVADRTVRLIAVGSLKPVKGYDRLLRIVKRLHTDRYNIHLYILGIGPLQKELERTIQAQALTDTVTLLGYDTNPYKYVAKCDLLLCASHAEGFSTAVTEALIVGTPVCTVKVSGMTELLGEENEWGIVTDNDEEALYHGIKGLLDDPALLFHYQKQAKIRGQSFHTEQTVNAVEQFLRRV